MRLRNVKNKEEILNNSKYVIDSSDYKRELFNSNPIHAEIGMGKGNFIIENAKANPNINYIGIEKYDSVLSKACQKLEGEELPNLILIRFDADKIHELFSNEIDTLYLNFSDPWPKDRHAKRRLTSDVFLSKYENIFKGDKHIIQKTDNRGLFEYSVMSFNRNNYKINELSLDLYKDEIKDNIPTEYEVRYRDKTPIYRIDVSK